MRGASLPMPKGWAETKRDSYWSDFLDPTGQVRLRANVTAGLTGAGTDQSAPDAARAELDRLRSAEAFRLISRRPVHATEETGPGAVEIVYQFSRDGQGVDVRRSVIPSWNGASASVRTVPRAGRRRRGR
jgi:hypothetical protein